MSLVPLSVFALEFLGHPLRSGGLGCCMVSFFGKQYFLNAMACGSVAQPGDHAIDAGPVLGILPGGICGGGRLGSDGYGSL